MLKKVHISKPERKSCTLLDTETVRCSICDGVSAKSVMRISDSGYVVRNTCQPDLATLNRQNGDSVVRLEYDCSNPRCEIKNSNNTLRSKILAGGDHSHCSKCFRAIANSKSLDNMVGTKNQIYTRYSSSIEEAKDTHEDTMEATIKYKNVNFRESDSLFTFSGVNKKETINEQIEKIVDVIHRPITCPVTECHKMIARASVLQHFFFDHSKIPRLRLSIAEAQSVFINLSAITSEIRCFAVFLIQNDAPLVHTTDSNTLTNERYYKNASFLLMGVRMQSVEAIKNRGEYDSIRKEKTQTEVQTKGSKIITNKNTDMAEDIILQHETIILWIYRLGDNTLYYDISVRHPDKKLGYSFTGNPLNVEDFVERPEIYDQVDCLRISEKSFYKLTNEQNELEVTVNIFK